MATRINTKGWAVLEAFANAHPAGATRAQVAETVGCTVQRVGEVLKDNPDVTVEGKEQGLAISPAKFKALTKAAEKVEADREKATAARAAEREKAAAQKANRQKAAAKAAHADTSKGGAAKKTATAKKLADALAAES